MKKLYLVFLMLLILFIPTTHAVAVYQLDQPVNELNGYTLREVFQDNNIILNGDFSNNDLTSYGWTTQGYPSSFKYEITNGLLHTYDVLQIYGVQFPFITTIGHKLYFNIELIEVVSSGFYPSISNYRPFYNEIGFISYIYETLNINEYVYIRHTIGQETYVDNLYLIDLTLLNIDNLTKEQMDVYYNLYLEAVRFEQDNIQAGQDPGGYQNIFNSIINGVKTLMQEMGYVWQWLNAPLITSDMQNFSINIDWSWDLLGVIRQILNGAGILTLQILFIVPSLAFAFMGIPVQISVLSLLFSNLIFLLLGWIMVKSFLI